MGSVPRESILNLNYISCVRHIRKINGSGCPGLGISFKIFVFERQRVAISRVVRKAGPGLRFHLPFALFRGHGLPSQSLCLSVWTGEQCLFSRSKLGRCGQAWQMWPIELCMDQSPPVTSAVSTGSQEAGSAQ